MTPKREEFLRKCQLPLLMVLVVLPLPLLLYAVLLPDKIWHVFLPAALFLLLAILCFRIPGKFRLLYGAFAGILQLCAGGGLIAAGDPPISLLFSAGCCLLLFLCLPIAGWPPEKELPAPWFYGGIVLNLAAHLVKFFCSTMEYADLDAAGPYLTLTFLLFAGLTMLSLTRTAMTDAGNGRQQVTKLMRKRNLTMTLVVFGIAAPISLFSWLGEPVRAFFGWLIQLFLQSLYKDSPDSDAAVSPPFQDSGSMAPAQEVEATLLTRILNLLFIILGYAVTAAVLCFALYLLIRGLYRLVQRLLRKMTDYAASSSGDYEDEITDLRPAARKRPARLSAAQQRALSPVQRIRYRYRLLLHRHPEWPGSHTAREHLPESPAAIYEKARYSPHPVTPEEAEAFQKQTKRL